jgi:four helix bundle protein
MGAKRFQDLICWQLSRELRKTVAALIKKPKLAADADLCGQLRRAARSATGNIAEGFPCVSNAEFARFLEIAIRSLTETEDRLIEAHDEQLLTSDEVAPALNLVKRALIATKRLRATRLQ